MSLFFVDTNVLLYAVEKTDPRKHDIAVRGIHQLIDDREGVVSSQVMAEFAANAIKKVKLPPDEVTAFLVYFEQMRLIPMTGALIRRGVQLRQIHQLSFWDACIIAAAEHAGCDVLLSEDFNAGQMYGNIRVENPFA